MAQPLPVASAPRTPTAGGATPPAPRLRLLALHSFRTSGAIFENQLSRAGLLKQLEDLAEFVFIDAPFTASGPIPRDVRPFFSPPFFEWFTVEQVGDRAEFDDAKLRGSLELVERVMAQRGPFDGIVGFSQGAILASVLVMLQHRGRLLQGVPPLKFCMLFAGLKSRHPDHAFETKVPVPSLHVYGDRDQIRSHCEELADAFESSVVCMHPKGHVIPHLLPHQLAVVRAFLGSFVPQQPLAGSQFSAL